MFPCVRACVPSLLFWETRFFSFSPFLEDMKSSCVDREETERVGRGAEQQQQAEDREDDSAFQ